MHRTSSSGGLFVPAAPRLHATRTMTTPTMSSVAEYPDPPPRRHSRASEPVVLVGDASPFSFLRGMGISNPSTVYRPPAPRTPQSKRTQNLALPSITVQVEVGPTATNYHETSKDPVPVDTRSPMRSPRSPSLLPPLEWASSIPTDEEIAAEQAFADEEEGWEELYWSAVEKGRRDRESAARAARLGKVSTPPSGRGQVALNSRQASPSPAPERASPSPSRAASPQVQRADSFRRDLKPAVVPVLKTNAKKVGRLPLGSSPRANSNTTTPTTSPMNTPGSVRSIQQEKSSLTAIAGGRGGPAAARKKPSASPEKTAALGPPPLQGLGIAHKSSTSSLNQLEETTSTTTDVSIPVFESSIGSSPPINPPGSVLHPHSESPESLPTTTANTPLDDSSLRTVTPPPVGLEAADTQTDNTPGYSPPPQAPVVPMLQLQDSTSSSPMPPVNAATASIHDMSLSQERDGGQLSPLLPEEPSVSPPQSAVAAFTSPLFAVDNAISTDKWWGSLGFRVRAAPLQKPSPVKPVATTPPAKNKETSTAEDDNTPMAVEASPSGSAFERSPAAAKIPKRDVVNDPSEERSSPEARRVSDDKTANDNNKAKSSSWSPEHQPTPAQSEEPAGKEPPPRKKDNACCTMM